MSFENLSNILNKLSLGEPSTDSHSLGTSINTNNDIHQEKINNNLVDNFSYNQTKMSNPEVRVEPFKTEYLNCVPEFDGNPNELGRYLSICESILSSFYDRRNPDSFHNVYLLNSLISKLKGNARLVINIQNVNSWDELKLVLTRNFADQRDETCLNRDLVLMKQLPNEKPQQFYDRCLNILNLLCSYVNCHEATDAAKELKRDLYQNLALKTFLSGLKEPLGTTIRCMKPNSLSQALQYVIQEDNAQYFQNFTNKNFMKPQHISRTPNFNQNNFQGKPNPFPSQPIPIQPRQNFQQRIPTNIPAFRQPHRNQNVFRPNSQNRNFTKPTPMSGVSVQKPTNQNTSYPSTSQGTFNQRFPQNNVKHYHNNRNHLMFEELYNAETDEPEQTDYDYQYYYNYNENYDDQTQDEEPKISSQEDPAENFPMDPTNEEVT